MDAFKDKGHAAEKTYINKMEGNYRKLYRIKIEEVSIKVQRWERRQRLIV